MNTSTSMVTIEKLRQSFAIHGLPETLVSDNGTCFTSLEFEVFMKKNGIWHIRSAPFHPAANGLAERAVQTLKQGLKKTLGGTLGDETPEIPVYVPELRLRRPRACRHQNCYSTEKLGPDLTWFSLVRKTRVVQRQMQQKLNHDHGVVREFRGG